MISKMFKGRFSSASTFSLTTRLQFLSVGREEVLKINFAYEGGDDLFQIACRAYDVCVGHEA